MAKGFPHCNIIWIGSTVGEFEILLCVCSALCRSLGSCHTPRRYFNYRISSLLQFNCDLQSGEETFAAVERTNMWLLEALTALHHFKPQQSRCIRDWTESRTCIPTPAPCIGQALFKERSCLLRLQVRPSFLVHADTSFTI